MSASQASFIEWTYRTLVGILIALGAWFGSQVWREQSALKDSYHQLRMVIEDRIRPLETKIAEMEGNRFTSSDFAVAKTVVDDRINGVDKRVIVLEAKVDSAADAARKASETSARNGEMLQRVLQHLEHDGKKSAAAKLPPLPKLTPDVINSLSKKPESVIR